MKSKFKRFQRSVSVFLVVLTLVISTGLASPPAAIASPDLQFSRFSRAEQARTTLSDKRLFKEANKFLYLSPEKFCDVYLNADAATWSALEKSAGAAFTITNALTHAAAAGAGTLTGYAGIASAISQLGMGGLTTAVAGFMGSHATGAAATAIVTSTIGGPVVMGTLLVGGTGAVAWGTYKLGKVAVGQLGIGDWAKNHCSKLSKSKISKIERVIQALVPLSGKQR